MGHREKMMSRISPMLPAGETYAAAVPAVGGFHPQFAFRYRIIVVTDRRVHLYSARLWRIGDPKRLLASLPEGTVLEPRRYFLYEEVRLAGERLWVSPAFQDDLSEAVWESRATARRWSARPGDGSAGRPPPPDDEP